MVDFHAAAVLKVWTPRDPSESDTPAPSAALLALGRTDPCNKPQGVWRVWTLRRQAWAAPGWLLPD